VSNLQVGTALKSGNPCQNVDLERLGSAYTDAPGTAVYTSDQVPAPGYSLLGSPTVIADMTVTGADPGTAQVAARLWDVSSVGGTTGGTTSGTDQRLIARALYRPTGDGRQVFQLHPNGWRFEKGHWVKLELLGNDAPYGRASNEPFAIAVSNLELRLPVWDQPGAAGGAVQAPAPEVLPRGATPVKDPPTVTNKPDDKKGPATGGGPRGGASSGARAAPSRPSAAPAPSSAARKKAKRCPKLTRRQRASKRARAKAKAKCRAAKSKQRAGKRKHAKRRKHARR
jgi:hypothetical protein